MPTTTSIFPAQFICHFLYSSGRRGWSSAALSRLEKKNITTLKLHDPNIGVRFVHVDLMANLSVASEVPLISAPSVEFTQMVEQSALN